MLQKIASNLISVLWVTRHVVFVLSFALSLSQSVNVKIFWPGLVHERRKKNNKNNNYQNKHTFSRHEIDRLRLHSAGLVADGFVARETHRKHAQKGMQLENQLATRNISTKTEDGIHFKLENCLLNNKKIQSKTKTLCMWAVRVH